MIYLLAEYAKALLDEFRPKKRSQAQIQTSIEHNPENAVCLN